MKTILQIMLLILVTTAASAKITLKEKAPAFLSAYGEGGFDPDRLIFGGNLGMNFVKKGYQLFISPTFGYSFGRLQLGISANYSYLHQKLPYNNSVTGNSAVYVYQASNYNLSVFTRFALLGPLFLHAEPGYGFYKVLEDPDFTYDPGTGTLEEHSNRFKIPSVLVGAGFAFPIGERVAFVIYGLYDVIQDPMSPYYGLPVIRGGFNVGTFR